jgi:predicted thioesterase
MTTIAILTSFAAAVLLSVLFCARWFLRARHLPVIVRRGTSRVVRYRTLPTDSVRDVAPGREWWDKPPVVSSVAVIRQCEELCMTALLEVIPDGHCSLGTGQQLDHCGPIAVGSEVEIQARCTRSRGRQSSWWVTVRDTHEVVGKGRFDFVIVDRSRFEERRLTPKLVTPHTSELVGSS